MDEDMKMPDVIDPTIDTVRDAVNNRQAVLLGWSGTDTVVLLDMFSASVMAQVYDKLNEQNQEKFRTWLTKSPAHFVKMHEISMRATQKV